MDAWMLEAQTAAMDCGDDQAESDCGEFDFFHSDLREDEVREFSQEMLFLLTTCVSAVLLIAIGLATAAGYAILELVKFLGWC